MGSALQVLVVDDEPAIRQILTAGMTRAGHSVEVASSGREALMRLAKGDVEVTLCDINMPDLTGIEVVKEARAQGIDTTFIMMTAYSSVDTAIEAMKAGAIDYMIKPLRQEELAQRLEQIAEMRGLKGENEALRKLVVGRRDDHCPAVSQSMKALDRLVAKVAPTDSTVLITGESGTGKGVTARAIHQQSQRAGKPFIPVNCGAIPENLLESEFFGHVKGAFTGADRARKGLFLEADKGTIFLDEIGELPLELQVKLLHVLEAREIRPLGSEQVRKVDVRIVAATNRDLKAMVAEGRFREDLYFRLSGFHITVPPLRERRDDIPALIKYLLARGAERFGVSGKLSIEPDAEELLIAYDWPGNVRELENVLQRATILADQGRITLGDLPPHITPVVTTDPGGTALPRPSGGTLREQVREYELGLILRAIDDCGGDRRTAAQKLGIGLSSLYRKLEENEAPKGQNEGSKGQNTPD
ncbi:sigma-54-dependent transcriptional regulator [Ramlibacter albus]|uniref:Sigma-54-dependent Fis family transcriptional regulator n=1 Tax=Ramlibacter albus TaxID=2079448 RepID=A0A923M525_9BURK|nr:sigma-54 dependent transcriptional regulator [Ramlibacter albus]MBC5764043.1 sigma-54-dependent Fis family transcriptional regulator [Ramlibacter albus]